MANSGYPKKKDKYEFSEMYKKWKQENRTKSFSDFMNEWVFPLAMYSPDAEASFIGKKGFERLLKAGLADKAEPFASRWFGNRWEILPNNATKVWWKMGAGAQGIREKMLARTKAIEEHYKNRPTHQPKFFQNDPTYVEAEIKIQQLMDSRITGKPITDDWNEAMAEVKRLRKMTSDMRQDYITRTNEFNSSLKQWNKERERLEKSIRYRDVLPPEQFPELAAAYPNLFNMPVNLNERGWYNHSGNMASYRPPDVTQSPAGTRRYIDAHRKSYSDADLEKINNRLAGEINLDIPDQGIGSDPAYEFLNSLLHETQHYIQREELQGKDILGFKHWTNQSLKDTLIHDFTEKYPPFHYDNALSSATYKEGTHLPMKEKTYDTPWGKDTYKGAPQGYQYRDGGISSIGNELIDLEVDPLYLYKMDPLEREAFSAANRSTALNPNSIRRAGERKPFTPEEQEIVDFLTEYADYKTNYSPDTLLSTLEYIKGKK